MSIQFFVIDFSLRALYIYLSWCWGAVSAADKLFFRGELYFTFRKRIIDVYRNMVRTHVILGLYAERMLVLSHFLTSDKGIKQERRTQTDGGNFTSKQL